jgi:hypothetical protein
VLSGLDVAHAARGRDGRRAVPLVRLCQHFFLKKARQRAFKKPKKGFKERGSRSVVEGVININFFLFLSATRPRRLIPAWQSQPEGLAKPI